MPWHVQTSKYCAAYLECVAVCCSVLQCVAVCKMPSAMPLKRYRRIYSVLQCVAACCSVLQGVAVCCSVMQCRTSNQTHIYRHTFICAICQSREQGQSLSNSGTGAYSGLLLFGNLHPPPAPFQKKENESESVSCIQPFTKGKKPKKGHMRANQFLRCSH